MVVPWGVFNLKFPEMDDNGISGFATRHRYTDFLDFSSNQIFTNGSSPGGREGREISRRFPKGFDGEVIRTFIGKTKVGVDEIDTWSYTWKGGWRRIWRMKYNSKGKKERFIGKKRNEAVCFEHKML